jgi:hypothetical protein
MVLSKEQIEHELEVIEKIDTIYLREKDRTTLDVNAYEARQVHPPSTTSGSLQPVFTPQEFNTITPTLVLSGCSIWNS